MKFQQSEKCILIDYGFKAHTPVKKRREGIEENVRFQTKYVRNRTFFIFHPYENAQNTAKKGFGMFCLNFVSIGLVNLHNQSQKL